MTVRRRYTARDPAVTSRIMSAVRSRDSESELALRKELWRRGLRYRLHASRVQGRAIPGRPDLVFVTARVIVFIDSDFWHGRVLLERGRDALALQFRPARRRWWVAKIAGNADRDRRHESDLKAAGWTIVRVWETDVLRDPGSVADGVECVVRRCSERCAPSLDGGHRR